MFFRRLILTPFLRLLSPRVAADPRRALGDAGEAAAATFLQNAGYKILVRNWRSGRDELDLVALAAATSGAPGDVLVFIEVKTRATGDLRGGYHAVDTRKKVALRRAVRAYLRSVRMREAPFRFDIVEVRHEENAPLRIIHHCAVPLFPG